jgi:hypothetical protein
VSPRQRYAYSPAVKASKYMKIECPHRAKDEKREKENVEKERKLKVLTNQIFFINLNV